MKKIILLFSILLLTACSHGNGAVESLKKEYPKTIKQVVDQLPKDVQKELVVPEKIPFRAKDVTMDVQKNQKNGAINATSFNYSNEEVEVTMFVITYHNKKVSFPDEQQPLKTTKLKDGTKVLIVADDDNTKTIRWKKDGLYHSISLLFSEETGKQYTIRDLIKTANSMSK
ncbi:hypothetical protein V7148_17800 [Gottfriedia acidiceleris]|uniref:hypothetical protein n=1 Tax=Bacillaceae TaxID=186817 RepID=UPI000BEC6B13|nr:MULTISPECIES: hypothetical protein [unclassified Bacillus (in: firmicutes)]PEC47747.1 hypothetical protein CON00_20270 [Bacillus sp. AFS096315]PFM83002.1 hypothetical protein COJ46_04150 [Bacillus sp. AFS077874]